MGGAQSIDLTKKSTSKYILNKTNYNSLERTMLTFSGLPKELIKQMDVMVEKYNDEPVYIRTIVCNDANTRSGKPVLVMLHGFGSAGALYYRILAPLQKKFKVIMIDSIGMGGSSRPDNYDKGEISAKESVDYFVDYIEKWRKSFGNLKDFILAGHSLGGYLAGHYAVKYP